MSRPVARSYRSIELCVGLLQGVIDLLCYVEAYCQKLLTYCVMFNPIARSYRPIVLCLVLLQGVIDLLCYVWAYCKEL